MTIDAQRLDRAMDPKYLVKGYAGHAGIRKPELVSLMNELFGPDKWDFEVHDIKVVSDLVKEVSQDRCIRYVVAMAIGRIKVNLDGQWVSREQTGTSSTITPFTPPNGTKAGDAGYPGIERAINGASTNAFKRSAYLIGRATGSEISTKSARELLAGQSDAPQSTQTRAHPDSDEGGFGDFDNFDGPEEQPRQTGAQPREPEQRREPAQERRQEPRRDPEQRREPAQERRQDPPREPEQRREPAQERRQDPPREPEQRREPAQERRQDPAREPEQRQPAPRETTGHEQTQPGASSEPDGFDFGEDPADTAPEKTNTREASADVGSDPFANVPAPDRSRGTDHIPGFEDEGEDTRRAPPPPMEGGGTSRERPPPMGGERPRESVPAMGNGGDGSNWRASPLEEEYEVYKTLIEREDSMAEVKTLIEKAEESFNKAAPNDPQAVRQKIAELRKTAW